MEQARPQTSGEEELQLQLALAMSREESEKPAPPVDTDEQTQLQIALSLSKEDAQKPASPPPVALDMDEERQLQIALSLSKEEHQQEQRSRQGDESLLQKALEESKREAASGGIGSAMMDLVEVFAVSSEVPPTASANSWSLPGGNVRTPLHHPLPLAQAAAGAASDPWDSLGKSCSMPLKNSTHYSLYQ
uniref:epsin-1-like n=1 Tax=Oncorhynchus gorbuscha TaxID=8017 RepID=UPI001EAEABF1|nr:epsin-1-like [Oncorhynchus gorbuscha]